jgi:protein-S-isoprenylcysteine O-methyltransferase Ste14
MKALARKTILGFGGLLGSLALLLFVPAGTLDFWEAWVYLLVFAASTGFITLYLWRKDPKLLERRVNAGPGAEKEPAQKRIQLLASLAFIGLFLLSSLDHRYSWSKVPLWDVFVGDFLVALGFLIVFLVFKENAFTAATIEVAPEQEAVSTGPYAIVRHPMYAGALVMLFGTPLALGSWWGLLMFVAMAGIIVLRLLDEEQFLSKHLPGYEQYRRGVRYRLVPFLF